MAAEMNPVSPGPTELTALQERAEKFQSIFENSALGIFQSTLSGRFLSVNPAFARLFGYDSPAEVIASVKDIGQQIYARREQREDVLAAITAGEGLGRFEAEFIRQDGQVFFALLSIRAIRDAAGRISHLDGFIEDVTEAKRREQAIQERVDHLARENVRLRASVQDRYRLGEIVGKSRIMQEVYEHVLQAAATDVSVIIYGESGTGKELVARAIHEYSERRSGEFVPVNCGAIPEHLLESEFFGHRRGSFSGASADTHGYLDLADGGTLFLDEVGELGLDMQVKLLRAIEGGGYYPVGDNRTHYSNFRLVAATNRNLREMVAQGLMREDFFFRIHIIPVALPPLRERKEDVPLLIDYYLAKFAAGQPRPVLPGRVLEELYNYDWPGNVRELQNVLRRYLAIKRLDFLGPMGGPAAPPVEAPLEAGEEPGTLAEMMDRHEKRLLLRALERHRWRRGRTAQALGIDRKTLFLKMRAHGMS